MKGKIIHCLAIVLSGVWFGCSANAPRSNVPAVSRQNTHYTRVYQIDINAFWPDFETQTDLGKMMEEAEAKTYGATQGGNALWFGSSNSTEVAQRALQKLLAGRGVRLQPPDAVFLNDRTGRVLVRATSREHDAIIRVLEDLNREPVGKL